MTFEDPSMQITDDQLRFEAAPDVTASGLDFEDRLSDRTRPSAMSQERSIPEPKMSGTRRWGAKPSVPAQMRRFPDTVRMRGMRTATFNLSDPAELQNLNTLQEAAGVDNPTIVITELLKEFHAGAWFCCVTYAALEYEQLH